MALASGNEIRQEEYPANLEFNSPSVGILSKRFPGPGKCQVLDLGAPAESNVAFFSGGSCRIYLEDLHRFFIAPRGYDNGDDTLAAAIADALSFENSARFDLVLAWDLFSYMDPDTIELLMARIARSCRVGTLLFLSISTRTMIPSVPAHFSMSRRGRLRYHVAAPGQTISNPRYSPTALEGMMPGFRLLHSFLLGENMQEFLFSFT
jgi:hypothetical protein